MRRRQRHRLPGGGTHWEVLLKVLDGCALGGHYNPLGRAARPVQDVTAFAACP